MRRLLPATLLLALVVAGCSNPLGSDDDPTPTPLSVDVGQDVESGCWTASQRTLPLADDDGAAGAQQWSQPPAMVIDEAATYTATMETSAGTIVFTLFASEAPNTVNNFVCLARAGFYDGVIFHRVVPNFVIQGGDPTGTGTGGPGYRIGEEPPTSRGYLRGTLAMAKTQQPNSTGSQFFVCLADVGLPPEYSIFGEVTSGLEVVDAISAAQIGPGDRPVEPVTITSVTVAETPVA